jgi:putative lipase involved disintegration of autophagic bodies
VRACAASRQLWVTGHSLGGALATLFVGQMMRDFPDSEANIGSVYTFGQPRLGDVYVSSTKVIHFIMNYTTNNNRLIL